jgi:hypothetical protein
VVVDRIGADKQRQENLLEFNDVIHCLQVVVDRIGADKQRQENLLEFSNIVHCLEVVVDRIGADKQRQETCKSSVTLLIACRWLLTA